MKKLMLATFVIIFLIPITVSAMQATPGNANCEVLAVVSVSGNESAVAPTPSLVFPSPTPKEENLPTETPIASITPTPALQTLTPKPIQSEREEEQEQVEEPVIPTNTPEVTTMHSKQNTSETQVFEVSEASVESQVSDIELTDIPDDETEVPKFLTFIKNIVWLITGATKETCRVPLWLAILVAIILFVFCWLIILLLILSIRNLIKHCKERANATDRKETEGNE